VKPDVDRLLEVAAAHLMVKTAPALGHGYEQSSAMALAAMLMTAREENDRGAARRVEENEALRSLFAEAESVVQDDPLRARLSGAAESRDDSLLLSDLDAGNARLRGLLIELHAHVEDLDSPPARRLEAAIWCELAASTERRKLALAPF
jgi:hypothetical protein